MEEQQSSDDKKNDSKYRRYVAALEKCLQSFESVNEWADVISFLSRLGKVFNSFPTFKEIPFKLNLAKRLAQCLNPALPAGVHQKTLEVYEMVFRKIGNENLVKDLSLYSFGLFPFFEHSATLVKNSLLELYEVYLVPLGPGLTPSLRPLVLSIILGLEEESSDYFTKVNNLLNRIKMAVGISEFYDAIWTGLLISPHHRLAIINFLLKNIPANASNQELMEICVNNTKLVASAISAALQDHGQLVVRGSLEILLKHFPIEKRFFETQQLTLLFKASMNVLTRKDMSLTRRFYTWILISGTSEVESLSDYNLNILILALNGLITENVATVEEFSKPFKLLVFILDKPMVSNPLIKDSLFRLVNLLIDASRKIAVDDFSKILHSANLLFRMLELDIIWGAFMREVNEIKLSNIEEAENTINAIDFATEHLCIFDDSSSMIQVHLLINCLLKRMFEPGPDKIHEKSKDSFINLCIKLNQRLSFSNIQIPDAVDETLINSLCVDLSLALLDDGIESSKLDHSTVASIMISNAKLITNHANQLIDFSNSYLIGIDICSKSSTFLIFMMNNIKTSNGKNIDVGFTKWFAKLLYELENCVNIDVIHSCLIQLKECALFWNENIDSVRSSLIGKTLPFLWKAFYENEYDDKLRICLIISVICHILPNETDIFFAQLLSTSVRCREFDVIENFTLFWDLAVSSQLLNDIPLRISVLVLVDSMSRNDFRFRKCSSSWIFSISKYLDRFLVPSMSSFIDILECSLSDASNSNCSSKKIFRKQFDKGPLIYYLNIIERLLEVNYEDILNYLTVTEIDPYLLVQMDPFVESVKKHLNIDFDFDFKNNYVNMLIIMCLPLIAMEEHKSQKSSASPARVAAINTLRILLKGTNSNALPLIRILLDFAIYKLNYFVCNSYDTEKQIQFLSLFNSLFTNEIITPQLSSHDILYLSETATKALLLSTNTEIIHIWSDFAMTLGLLPNSNFEIVMSILNDALINRLNCANDQCFINPAITSSIFVCVAKLSVFYLAAKSNIFSGTNNLRSSISCLLNEVKTEATIALSSAKLSAAINLDDFEKIIFGLLNAHQIALKDHNDEKDNDNYGWKQCNLVLKDSCSLLFSINRSLITEVLVSVFIKQHKQNSGHNFHSFMTMFYDQEASEFLRSVVNILRTSKEVGKNQEILLLFMLEFSKFETNENVILDLWVILMNQLKELSSSGFKYKSVMWLLIENACHLMGKIEPFDPNRISKDFDWIIKLIENSVVYASRLNEPSQWASRTDEIVEIPSERFNSIVIENVKDKNVGKCIISICQVLIPNITRYLGESDKLNLVINPIVINLVSPNFKSPLRFSLMGQISVFCFKSVLKINFNSNKAWKREIWDAFFDNSFLWMPHYYFPVMCDAFKIVTSESERFSEVLAKFSTSATASMFLSKEAEILSKAVNIRRLSFLTFWGNFDVFRIHLPSFQEKLVELTKYYNGFVLGEIFFLIRVFLLRLSDESISSLWPLIMTELVQLFENSIKMDQINSSDLFAIFQACKLIDLMLTLRTSSILLYHWLFFDSAGRCGLFSRLEEKIRNGPRVSDYSNTSYTGQTKRRPLFSSSSAKEASELLPFLATAGSHLSHDYIMIQNLDMDFIDKMTENDLLEIIEIK